MARVAAVAGQRQRVVIVGGGIAGVCSALALADDNDVVMLEGLDELLTQTSWANVGRIHLGFHYALDDTMDTANLLVPGWFAFYELLGRWTDGELEQVEHSRPYWWLVANDSFVAPPEYRSFCERLVAIYDEQLGVSDRAERFPAAGSVVQPLPEDEYGPLVNTDRVVHAVGSMERAIKLGPLFEVIGRALARKPSIEIRRDHRLEEIHRDGSRHVLAVTDTSSGRQLELICDQVVNATNAHRLLFDSQEGYLPERQWMDRLKVLVDIELPPALVDANSMQVALGPYGHITNYGDGTACCGYMPVSIRGASHAITVPEEWDRICELGYDEETVERIGRETVDGIAKYVPGIAGARVTGARCGIVHATGTTPITDPNSELHRRSDSGVHSLGKGYHSFNAGKLCLAPLHASALAQRVAEHAQMGASAIPPPPKHIPVHEYLPYEPSAA